MPQNWKLDKKIFLAHLQPTLDKNSEDLAGLILEFDNVTVKNHLLFFFLLLSGIQLEVQFCTVPARPITVKSPFNAMHEPLLNFKNN